MCTVKGINLIILLSWHPSASTMCRHVVHKVVQSRKNPVQTLMATQLGQGISKTHSVVVTTSPLVQWDEVIDWPLWCKSNRQTTVAEIAKRVDAGSDRQMYEHAVHHNLLHMGGSEPSWRLCWNLSTAERACIFCMTRRAKYTLQPGSGSLMPWAIFSWEMLGPALCVDVISPRTTRLL